MRACVSLWRSATPAFAARSPTTAEASLEGRVSMPDEDAESGRGLAFLDAIADRWGVIRDGENCVWFELDLDGE